MRKHGPFSWEKDQTMTRASVEAAPGDLQALAEGKAREVARHDVLDPCEGIGVGGFGAHHQHTGLTRGVERAGPVGKAQPAMPALERRGDAMAEMLAELGEVAPRR